MHGRRILQLGERGLLRVSPEGSWTDEGGEMKEASRDRSLGLALAWINRLVKIYIGPQSSIHLRGDSGLDDLFRDDLETVDIDIIVSFVDGEVNAVCPICLEIQD